MQTYPKNSPQAAARILALTALTDGHVSAVEVATLERLGADKILGLERSELLSVMRSFCEDLLQGAQMNWTDACNVDSDTVASLLAEIDDPGLRRTLIRLCVATVEADGHTSEDESRVLDAVAEQWGLRDELPRPRDAA